MSARAGRREWLGLAVMLLPCLLISMDMTVLHLAVPHLTAELRPSAAQLLWIVDIYGFLVAGFLITMGTLGDRIGRRRLLLIGGAAFGAASALAAFSTSPETLIVTRALLGVAAATLAPSTLSLIRNMFHHPDQRTLAIALWGTGFSVGGAIGPLMGGLLLEHFWWGSVFLINVPVMLLLLATGPWLLPEYRDPDPGRLDLASAALAIGGVLATLYGLKRMAEHGLDGGAWLAVLSGLTLAAAFVGRQRRLASPMIDPALFRIPAFRISLAANGLSLFMAVGSFLFIAQYLQLVLGLSPLDAGLWTLPSALGFVVSSLAAPALARRLPRVQVMGGGLGLAAAGFVLIGSVDGDSGLAAIVAGSTAMSLGISPVVIMGTDLVVGVAPPQRAGAAAAISETCVEFGAALGIALLGSLGTLIYRHQIALPTGLSAEAAELARATLSGAVEVAGQLPGATGGLLLESARSAFAQSLQAAAWACAAIALATALMVVALLRRRPPGDADLPGA